MPDAVAQVEAAQLPGQEPNEAPPTEIIVTALRHSTTVQQTPAAITAVDGETLHDANILDPSGLGAVVPGLTVLQGGASNSRLVMRGIETVGEPTVGLYYDETPISGLVGSTNDAGGSPSLLKLIDVDHVEGLRGPQGTLYGAGAMTGALRIIFEKPQFETSGEASIAATAIDGGELGYRADGVINVPLVDDKLAFRGVVYGEYSGGYIDSLPLHEDNVNGQDTKGFRGALRWLPDNELTIDVSAAYQDINGDRPIWNLEAGAYNALNQIRFVNDDEQDLFNITARWDLGWAVATGVFSDDHRHLLQVSNDFSPFLETFIGSAKTCAALAGGVPCSAPALAAYNQYVLSGTPSGVYPDETENTRSAEIRLTATNSAWLDWTFGIFYSDRDTHIDNRLLKADRSTGAITEPFQYLFERLINDDLQQIAGYVDLPVKLTSDLTFTAGMRYFSYDRAANGDIPIGYPLIAAAPSPYAAYQSSEQGTVLKFNLAWQAEPDLLLYFDASQGYRPGGVNQVFGLPAALTPYQSDSLWDYEIGEKSRWFSGLLTLDSDLFHIDWDNMQVTGTRPDGLFSFLSNAGAASINGLETEISLNPALGLTIQANAAWLDARLSQDQINSNVVAPGRAGDRIPYTPRVTAAGTVDDVVSGSTVQVGIDNPVRFRPVARNDCRRV
ncbi:MAG: TonB-dependent receptor [Aliidongia sp.]